MAKRLGQVLRQARERVGLSQSALARAISGTQAQISRLEGGQREVTRFDTIARIAEVTGASLDHLAYECGYISKPSPARRSPSAGLTRALTRIKKASKSAESASRDLEDAMADLESLAKQGKY